jgi:hypothetical protein
MISCALCNFADDVSVVDHIRRNHNLQTYLNLFPDLPVVNKDLYTAIENAVYFKYMDDTPGLEGITAEEREMILVAAKNNAHLRSEIIETTDF